MKRILFVCTGNICRSPTAEGVLQHKLIDQGADHLVSVASAGLSGAHFGEPVDERAMNAALRRGYDLESIHARTFGNVDFYEFDLIIAMDRSHFDALEKQIPDNARAELRLFMEYVQNSSIRDVPDPYYGTESDFEAVLDLIEQGVDGLLDDLGV